MTARRAIGHNLGMSRKPRKQVAVAFDRPTRSRIAVAAKCDERTVYRFLRGDHATQRAIADAIERAIKEIQEQGA